MKGAGDQDVIRADRWCCRVALVVELLLIAWSGGRSAAGADLVDITVLCGAVGICLVSLGVALTLYGARVLTLDDDDAGNDGHEG